MNITISPSWNHNRNAQSPLSCAARAAITLLIPLWDHNKNTHKQIQFLELIICPGKFNVSTRKTFLRLNHFVTVFTLDKKTLLTCCAMLLDICKTTASRTVRTQCVLSVCHCSFTQYDIWWAQSWALENTGLLDFKCCTQRLPFVSRAAMVTHFLCNSCNMCESYLPQMNRSAAGNGEGHVWGRRGSEHWEVNTDQNFFFFTLFNEMSCWCWFLSLLCCFVMFSCSWTLVWNCVCSLWCLALHWKLGQNFCLFLVCWQREIRMAPFRSPQLNPASSSMFSTTTTDFGSICFFRDFWCFLFSNGWWIIQLK